jgi:murein hydrolase activator
MKRTLLLGLGLIAALAAAAPPTREQLQQAEQARAAQLEAQKAANARAAAAAAQAQLLAEQRTAALASLREAEAATDSAASRVQDLSRRRQQAQLLLARRAADLAPFLPLIERLGLYPAETLLAVPLPPEQAIRGVVVLGGLTRQLEQDATALRAEQAKVAALQTSLDAEMQQLEAARATQAERATALDERLAEARAAGSAAEAEGADAARRAAAEGARADTIRTAIARIEAERHAAEARARAEAAAADRQKNEAAAAEARKREAALSSPAGSASTAMRAPVAGTVIRDFGESTVAGPAVGVSYNAAPAARVTSPCGGRVVFAGPFRSFGLLLILDCGGGFHFVLAGFERLDAHVGQSVAAGEPVGVMGGWDPRDGGGPRPVLYVELRHNGRPVNPASYIHGQG